MSTGTSASASSPLRALTTSRTIAIRVVMIVCVVVVTAGISDAAEWRPLSLVLVHLEGGSVVLEVNDDGVGSTLRSPAAPSGPVIWASRWSGSASKPRVASSIWTLVWTEGPARACPFLGSRKPNGPAGYTRGAIRWTYVLLRPGRTRPKLLSVQGSEHDSESGGRR